MIGDLSDVIAQIKSRPVDRIIELVSGAVIGRNRKMICPFCSSGAGVHKTPAFHVYESDWMCFSCSERGDAIDYAEKVGGMSFMDALKFVANEFGIPYGEVTWRPLCVQNGWEPVTYLDGDTLVARMDPTFIPAHILMEKILRFDDFDILMLIERRGVSPEIDPQDLPIHPAEIINPTYRMLRRMMMVVERLNPKEERLVMDGLGVSAVDSIIFRSRYNDVIRTRCSNAERVMTSKITPEKVLEADTEWPYIVTYAFKDFLLL